MARCTSLILVKRRALIRRLRSIAKEVGGELEFVREGANHEIWTIAGQRIAVPRHTEINERTAQGIIKFAEEVTTDGKARKDG